MKYETQNTGIENMRYDFMPVGSIVPFASDIIPLGWLLCDGAPIERSRYPELYDLIGDKLPDHRGMFLRGNDNGRGIDAGRVLGSEQGDLANVKTSAINRDSITHLTLKNTSNGEDSLMNNTDSVVYVTSLGHAVTSVANVGSVSQTTIELKQDETRPKNNSVNYIIKALHIANPSMEYQVADGLNHKIETNRNTIDFNLLATLGISYGGILNNTSPKLAGVAYYDEIARKLFKCIANTSINYADAGYFEAISNNDLLSRLHDINRAYGNFNQNFEKTDGNITIENPVQNIKSMFFTVAESGIYLITATQRCTKMDLGPATCSIKKNDLILTAHDFNLSSDGVGYFEGQTTLSAVTFLGKGDIVEIYRSTAIEARQQRVFSIVKLK